MRVAVIGGGVSGLGSAYVLARDDAVKELVLFEKEDSLGGHARKMRFDGVDLDLGFTVFNSVRMLALTLSGIIKTIATQNSLSYHFLSFYHKNKKK